MIRVQDLKAAMEAGIADQVWSVEEIVALLDADLARMAA
jgi:hypothetical protein